MEISDIGPTLLELIGGETNYNQFAKSLCGTLKGGDHREDGLSEVVGEFMLMNEEWKIALNKKGRTYLLFNRQNDPHELENLAGAGSHRSKEVELRHRILERIIQSQNELK